MDEESALARVREGEALFSLAGQDANCTHILDGAPVYIDPPPLFDSITRVTVDRVYCNAERWASMSDAKRAEWSEYKQALRDFPSICDSLNPIWPTMPA
jgi:hypothetical protein